MVVRRKNTQAKVVFDMFVEANTLRDFFHVRINSIKIQFLKRHVLKQAGNRICQGI
jgi:hypothetical protein